MTFDPNKLELKRAEARKAAAIQKMELYGANMHMLSLYDYDPCPMPANEKHIWKAAVDEGQHQWGKWTTQGVITQAEASDAISRGIRDAMGNKPAQ